MYLSISTKDTNQYISSRLSKLNIECLTTTCVDLIPDSVKINHLKSEINQFDVVIITSPAVISYIRSLFSLIDKHVIFIVSGINTKKILENYVPNQIIAPHAGSGADAIIKEVLESLDLSQKKTLILRGVKANITIEKFLDKKYGANSYLVSTIYYQEYQELNNLKKLFSNNKLQGIILTSSQHAIHLFSQAQKFDYYDDLKSVKFFVLHARIAIVLKNYGIENLLITKFASKQLLIDLIGKLHDR